MANHATPHVTPAGHPGLFTRKGLTIQTIVVWGNFNRNDSIAITPDVSPHQIREIISGQVIIPGSAGAAVSVVDDTPDAAHEVQLVNPYTIKSYDALGGLDGYGYLVLHVAVRKTRTEYPQT